MKQSRRKFIKQSAWLALLANADSRELAWGSQYQKKSNKLSYLAHRSTDVQGEKTLTEIEGRVPAEIGGQILRLAPGRKEVFGEKLAHLFDGDPYLSCVDFSGDSIKWSGMFIQTPKVIREAKENKMVYTEFGTDAPGFRNDHKFSPNVNVIPYQDKLLLLSESSLPTGVSRGSWSYLGFQDFSGNWPDNLNFTAHPKLDTNRNKLYAYGIKQALGLDLMVYEIDPQQDKAKLLYSQKQKKAHVIHDMLMTENYLILVIPPLYIDWTDLAFSKKPIAQALRYDEKLKTKILILSKKPDVTPIEIVTDPFMCFHHGNAFEKNGQIIFDSFVAKDASIFSAMGAWRSSELPKVELPALTRFVLSLEDRKIVSMEKHVDACDLPALDLARLGLEQESIYMTRILDETDPLVAQAVAKYNFSNRELSIYAQTDKEVYGEPLLHDRWMFVQGYSQSKDQSFLDILSAESMLQEARLWYGHYQPLGFHGCYLI